MAAEVAPPPEAGAEAVFSATSEGEAAAVSTGAPLGRGLPPWATAVGAAAAGAGAGDGDPLEIEADPEATAASEAEVSTGLDVFWTGPTDSMTGLFSGAVRTSPTSVVRDAELLAVAEDDGAVAGRAVPTMTARRSPSLTTEWGSGRERSSTTRVTGSGAVWN